MCHDKTVLYESYSKWYNYTFYLCLNFYYCWCCQNSMKYLFRLNFLALVYILFNYRGRSKHWHQWQLFVLNVFTNSGTIKFQEELIFSKRFMNCFTNQSYFKSCYNEDLQKTTQHTLSQGGCEVLYMVMCLLKNKLFKKTFKPWQCLCTYTNIVLPSVGKPKWKE